VLSTEGYHVGLTCLASRAHPLRVLLLLGLSLGAASTRADDDTQPPVPTVAALDFRGNDHVSSGDLRRRILTRGPSWKPWEPAPVFDEAVLEEDLERIRALYRERGYYEAEVTAEQAWRDDPPAVDLTIVITEGEPVRLARVGIEQIGPHPLAASTWAYVTADLPFRRGEIFGVDAYRKPREELLRRLANQAHPAPRLEGGARVDLATHEASVDWRVDPGPQVRFGPIAVEGLEHVDEALVRRELSFETGQVYSLEAQRTSQLQIFGLALFRSVTIEPVVPERDAGREPPAEAVWPIVVRVDERPSRTLRIGGGYGTSDLLRGRVDLTHRNFLGQARRLDLSFRASFISQGFDGRLVQPRFLLPSVRLELDTYFLRETVPAYDALRASAGFTLFHQLTDRWEVRGGYEFEFANETPKAFEDFRPEQDARISQIRLGLRRSTLDNPISPDRGTWLDLSADPAFRAIGSTSDWVPLVAEIRAFQRLRAVVLAGRFKIGTIQPFNGSGNGDVPAVRRFYAGGSTSVRGYGYQRLGPTDPYGNPTGGLSLSEASAELRFPIWRSFSGVAFVDAGLLGLSPWSFPVSDIQYGAGGGLRLATPVGPIRLDLAFPINPRSGIDRLVQVYLAVGHAF
jgi:outer membrane protein assembly complex protein YaeT